MKEIILVLAAIIMLTGLVHTLLYSSFLVNIVIGLTYFLGAYGLWNMYESIKYKNKQKRYIVLFSGAICVLIAYFSLELLLIW